MYARKLYDNSIIEVNIAHKWLIASHPKAIYYFKKDGLLYVLEEYDKNKGGLQSNAYVVRNKIYMSNIAKVTFQADVLKDVYHKCYGYEQMSIFDFSVLEPF